MINIINYIKSNFDSKQKKLLLITIIICSLSSIVVSISPVILASIINQITSENLLGNINYIVFLSIIYVIILSAGRLLPILSGAMIMLLQIDRKLVFSHSFFLYLYHQRNTFFEKNNSGSISQQSVQLNNEMHSLFNLFINGFFDPILKLIISMSVILLSGDATVLFLFMVYIILFSINTQFFTKKLTKIKQDLMNAGRDTYKIQIDSVENILLAKNNNAFDILFKRYAGYLGIEKNVAISYVKCTNKMILLNTFLSLFLLGGCFVYSLYSVINGWYSIGHFVMITSYIMMLSAPIESLSNNYSQLSQSVSVLDELVNKMNTQVFDNDKYNEKDILSSITISDLSFNYTNKIEKALDNINLKIDKGSFVTFTGESGSGKTTLAKLLSYYYADYHGEIFLNNKSIHTYPEDFLRRKMYSVSQDDFIFMDTLRFNLLISHPEATDEELLNALALACFYDPSTMSAQEEQKLLDMKLGNRGTTISGGQRQRISLARLFLKTPDIIIIDESTSSLDLINEKKVLNNIIDKFPNAIKISISHRPTTFRYSDRIYIFDNGKIVDQGLLTELLERNAYLQHIMKTS
ncbi:ATP-binding cassette domain-containing protein [Aggregatibacter actinomycetemcomitans]|uniref:ATP-binding cassette domain-containing protein n=1 Tax=Aggregatibacter actinomycetemcomitans TaxID=714 RepID=UPI00197C97A7|nr:ATP-binding cassette domain-containing protein [Aggregatibacter actinomycetemcomitans]MBN6079937.1 ATP-binding cassette domain-containing protein [Aggregatibacter actinomycetemcomitans]